MILFQNTKDVQYYKIPPYYRLHVYPDKIQIYSLARNKARLLTPSISRNGYQVISINKQTKYIHHLIAEYCLGPRPNGMQINHKDGNKLNNHPSNLEYCTSSQNVQHAVDTGLVIPKRLITDKQMEELRAKYNTGQYSCRQLGRIYGISKSYAYKIAKNHPLTRKKSK